MKSSLPRARAAAAGAMLALRAGAAWADHGAAAGREGLGPLTVAILAGVLTLAAGVGIVALAMVLTRKTPPSE